MSSPRKEARCCARPNLSAPTDDDLTSPIPVAHRFVLANTEVLHEKINVLASRVRQLEDALQDAHAGSGAAEPHPLLTEELLLLKRPLERETQEEVGREPEVESGDVVDRVGAL